MTVLDVCSVKEHPARAMGEKLTIPGIDLIATHPMFGPDSGRDGLNGLRLVMSPVSGEGTEYRYWRTYFTNLGVKVVEISPAEHDRLAAYTQGITHYVGRVLKRLELSPTVIDTKSFGMLLSVVDQTCNDTLELFQDLQNYNRFTVEMRRELDHAMHVVDSHLLGSCETGRIMRIGIQESRGCLNEAAVEQFCRTHHVESFQTLYFRRAEFVLESLQKGQIDRGVFALATTRANYVKETLEALTTYPCKILDTIDIATGHCLATRLEVELVEVDTIVSHPQLLVECAPALKDRYKHMKLVATDTQEFRDIAGPNFFMDLTDGDTCARYLAEGKLQDRLALIVSPVEAEVFGLRIHEPNLQGSGDDNRTTFAWATRREYR